MLLFVSAAMASLPTAADSDASIAAFYREHGAIVVLQQVVGALAVFPFVIFGLSLRSGRLLKFAVGVFVAVELVTNILPLLIVVSPGGALALTRVEDVADDLLFVAMTIFVLAATLDQAMWIRIAAYAVAVACVLRTWGVAGFGAVAPLAFIAFVLVVSVHMLLVRTPVPAAQQVR